MDGARKTVRAVAVLLALAGAVAGCTSAGTATPSPTPSAAEDVSSSVTWGPTSLLTCTQTATESPVDPDSAHSGSTAVVTGTTTATVACGDARVTGALEATWSRESWNGASGTLAVTVGEATLRNDGGSWTGDFSGVTTPETGEMTLWWLVGSGAYEGLTLGRVVQGDATGWIGLIYPGDPPDPGTADVSILPPPPAEAAPIPTTGPSEALAFGPATFVTGSYVLTVEDGDLTFDADGTAHSRGGWTVVQNGAADPRAAGTKIETWDSDRWGSGPSDGALVQWGAGTMTNSAGSWVGDYTGIYSSETGDRIMWWMTGTGDYAGLTLVRWIYDATGPWYGAIFPGEPPGR